MNNHKYRTAIIIFICSAFILLGTEKQVSARIWKDGTSRFRENAIILAQTLGHNDRAMLAPAAANAIPPAEYEIGDKRGFFAIKMTNGAQYSLTAFCHAVSDKAYIFIEDDVPADSGKIKSLLAKFDEIYNTITGHFGPSPDSIDGDPRIYILILDIVDAEQADGAETIGYFDATNQYRNDQLPRWTNQSSNEVEMLYIDYTALDFEPHGAGDVVAHEFAHLVQWARDPEEAIWVDEGIAVYVETVLGYKVDAFVTAFEEESDIPLMNWYNSLADYGAAYLFFAYISEKYGGVTTIAAIVKSENQSTDGIESALAAQGEFISFPDLFSDWVIANYLDDPDLDNGVYGYSKIDVNVNPSVVEDAYPIANKEFAIEPWAAHYIIFNKDQEDALDIAVYNSGRWNDTIAYVIKSNGGVDVSSIKSSGADSGETLITRQNQKIILVVTSQPDPPDSRRKFSGYFYSAEVRQGILSVKPISGAELRTWGGIKIGK